jgi:hypothetical protein
LQIDWHSRLTISPGQNATEWNVDQPYRLNRVQFGASQSCANDLSQALTAYGTVNPNQRLLSAQAVNDGVTVSKKRLPLAGHQPTP